MAERQSDYSRFCDQVLGKPKVQLSMDHLRTRFMKSIMSSVWKKLNDVGIDYTYGEIKEHFKDMMKNEDVQEEIEDVFYDRFISI